MKPYQLNKLNFFCPNCFNHISIPINLKLNVDINDDTKIWMGRPVFDFHRRCENCNHIMETIDDKIFSLIIDFNKLGYYTMFSCEGHYTPQYNEKNKSKDSIECSLPYITFSSSNIYLNEIENFKSMSTRKEEILINTFETYANPSIIKTEMFDFENSNIMCFYVGEKFTNEEYEFFFKYDNWMGVQKFEAKKDLFVKELNKILDILKKYDE
jgi:hypothetical protein